MIDLRGSEDGKIRQRAELSYNLVPIKSLAHPTAGGDMGILSCPKMCGKETGPL